MKRLISVLLTAAVLVGLAAVPASAATRFLVGGCDLSQSYFPVTNNGLAWSDSDQAAFHTPMRRAGACRHVWFVSLGVNAAPPCTMAMVRTYNEGTPPTVRVNGPWHRFQGVGDAFDLRPTIDNMRLYRVYARGCYPFDESRYTPGFRVYTHAP